MSFTEEELKRFRTAFEKFHENIELGRDLTPGQMVLDFDTKKKLHLVQRLHFNRWLVDVEGGERKIMHQARFDLKPS